VNGTHDNSELKKGDILSEVRHCIFTDYRLFNYYFFDTLMPLVWQEGKTS